MLGATTVGDGESGVGRILRNTDNADATSADGTSDADPGAGRTVAGALCTPSIYISISNSDAESHACYCVPLGCAVRDSPIRVSARMGAKS